MGNRSFFNALHDREGDFLLATVLEGPAQGERVLLRNTAPVWPEELPAFWGEHLPALAAVTSSGILKSAGQRIFVERFGAAPQLVVCGGGHVGASVVRLAKLLGLPVTALEDRPEFAEELRQAGADAVLCLPFAEGLAQIPGGQETYFVVVTRAHSCDIACLRSILQKPAAYVGMMGSRKRAALVHTQLAELGLPQERIDALHAPIGLSIGAKTAQEIALSILAEIVSVKNSRQQTEGFSPVLLAALAHFLTVFGTAILQPHGVWVGEVYIFLMAMVLLLGPAPMLWPRRKAPVIPEGMEELSAPEEMAETEKTEAAETEETQEEGEPQPSPEEK